MHRHRPLRSAAVKCDQKASGRFCWWHSDSDWLLFHALCVPYDSDHAELFLNREGVTRGDSLKQALLFCLGIVVLFTAMGIAVTALVGPFGVVQLGSNPWVNGFIALVFLAFGLSLLGAYEITLPSGLLTKMDQVSQRGGILGTLFMGLTFSLTSFACVGPFVGTLLAGSVQRGGDRTSTRDDEFCFRAWPPRFSFWRCFRHT